MSTFCDTVEHLRRDRESFTKNFAGIILTNYVNFTPYKRPPLIEDHCARGFPRRCPIYTVHILLLRPISQTIFPSQLRYDGKFLLLSSKFKWTNHYNFLHMAQQLCCCDMCKNSQCYLIQEWNCTEINFQSNVNFLIYIFLLTSFRCHPHSGTHWTQTARPSKMLQKLP